MRKCSENGCQTQPSFGLPGTKIGIYCSRHAKDGYVDVRNKKCSEEGCSIKPNYGPVGGKPTHCATHKRSGYINLTSRICKEEGCVKQPSYGAPGTKNAIYCSTHARNGHVDVRSKRCSEEGCYIGPCYGPVGGKPTHCATHKKAGHVPNKKCSENGCQTRPMFGLPGTKTGIYCLKHTKYGYVNVVSKKCLEEGCETQPRFGLPGTKIGIYCSKHSKDGYVNVLSKKCLEEGCEKRPGYGSPETKTATYCSEHARDGYVDVITKRCESDSCSIYTQYERSFSSKIDHNTGKKICFICWSAMYPELSSRKIRKEQFILAEVQRQIPELSQYFIVWDCKIPGQSCVSYKPDMAWEICDTLLHIEIDEDGDSHEDDDQRIVAIHSASNKKNHVCIRFNPDKSKDGSPPCLKRTTLSNGMSVYSGTPIEWEKRMNILVPEVRQAYENALVYKSVCGKRKLCF